MAALVRTNIGSAVTVTTANSIVNNAYANSADKLHIDNTGNALLGDFRLTGVSFGAAPTAGVVQIVVVDRDFAGNAGPTPSSSMLGRVYSMTPSPSTSNASTGWVLACNSVPIPDDCDVWIFNNNTGQTIASGCTLSCQLWSPGT